MTPGQQGRAVKFDQPENKMSCAQREHFFCSWVGQKSSGVGCSSVEIPCSGVEIGGLKLKLGTVYNSERPM